MLVDRAALSKHYDGDIEIQKELIEIFNDTYPKNLSQLELAVSEKNFENIHLHAHTLKGMIANFFSPELVENALFLENCGRNKKLEGSEEHLQNLKDKISVLVSEIRELS